MSEHHPATDDSSHTPGPWVLNADAARHEPGFYGSPSEPGEPEVYTAIHIGGHQRLTGFMLPADARLIAAAPDLLAALQKLVAWQAEIKHAVPLSYLDAAKEAITKATGTDFCEGCNDRLITGDDARCDVCRENANERAYDRAMEEPTYRGSEYASELAESQARVQRELK